MSKHSRRDFLMTTLAGGAAALAGCQLIPSTRVRSAAPAAGAPAPVIKPKVGLTAGEDRADNTFRALRFFEKEIAAAIGDKRVIIKPNNVVASNDLACTGSQNIEGILEFLKSIGKLDNAIIAESGAFMPTMEGYESLGYNPVAAKYKVQLVDLDKDEFEILACLDQGDMRSHPCRMSKMLMDPNSFVISTTVPKTHDSVVATLSLKNIVLAAPLKVDRRSDKRLVHGNGPWAINYNIANFASRLRPHLSIIDGYRGMEGNGPVGGSPVEHRVCLAGMDWLATDRVALELMGIDPAKVGYLVYCQQMKMGEYDLGRIDVLGETVKNHIKSYKLSDSIERQLQWMTPPPRDRRS